MTELEQVKAERDALAAHLSRLRDVFDREEFSAKGLQALEDAFNATPRQHLAELKAEAGRAGYVAGYSDGYNDNALDEFNQDAYADHYADSIRQEGK